MSKIALLATYQLSLPRAKEAVLEALAYYADEQGRRCYPSVATLAEKAKYSERQVRRILRQLEQDGLITPVSFAEGGRSRATEYALLFVGQKADIASSNENKKADIPSQKADIPSQKADILSQKADILSQKADILSQKADKMSADSSIKLNTKEDSKLFSISLDGKDFEVSYLVLEFDFKHWIEANLEQGRIISPAQWKEQQNTLLEIHCATNVAISKLISKAIEKNWKTFFPIKNTVPQTKDFPAAPRQEADMREEWQTLLRQWHKKPHEVFTSPRWNEIRDFELPNHLREFAKNECKKFYEERARASPA